MTIQGGMGGFKVNDADISAILTKRLSILGTTLRARDLEYKVSFFFFFGFVLLFFWFCFVVFLGVSPLPFHFGHYLGFFFFFFFVFLFFFFFDCSLTYNRRYRLNSIHTI
jgi:hypothetical protein